MEGWMRDGFVDVTIKGLMVPRSQQGSAEGVEMQSSSLLMAVIRGTH